jgi:transposase
MACLGNVIEYIDDWCSDYYWGQYISPQNASLLFSSISLSERIEFFKAWVPRNLTNEYIAYDVTSFSTGGKRIEDAEWGYNRDGGKIPQINLGCYLIQETGMPVFYVTYPGSIVDKSHLPYMMAYNDELGIIDLVFVLDKGFYTTSNIQSFHSNGIRYLIAVDKFHKTTQAAIDQVREGLISMKNQINEGIYAKTIQSRFYGVSSFMGDGHV